ALGAATEIAEAVRSEATVSKTISLSGGPLAPESSDDVVMACCEAGETARSSEHVAQSHLLRDVFHGPLRPVRVRGRWRSTAVLGLARTMYEDRAFNLMPDLGDALRRAAGRTLPAARQWLDGDVVPGQGLGPQQARLVGPHLLLGEAYPLGV